MQSPELLNENDSEDDDNEPLIHRVPRSGDLNDDVEIVDVSLEIVDQPPGEPVAIVVIDPHEIEPVPADVPIIPPAIPEIEPVPAVPQILPPAEQPNAVNMPPPPPTANESPPTPSPAKKRKRTSLGSTPKLKNLDDLDDNEDDGLTCPICLDSWEMSGEHRLVSLKCGHLFGDSCIRRWLLESGRNGLKCCPQCKTRAVNRDIRCLYARRIRALDRSEEHRLREQLDQEKAKVSQSQTELATLKMSYTMILQEVQKLAGDNERLKNSLRQGGAAVSSNVGSQETATWLRSYKLFMEKNIEISKDPGCRVMIYSQNFQTMLVSQKSSQNLFPGYGLRFIDTPHFRPTTFLHTSAKTVRDISFSSDQRLLVVASMESKVKIFDTTSRTPVSVFSPTDKPLWACSFDIGQRENTMYLGAQHGSTYSYDIRFPETIVEEFKTEGDLSPVINIAPVSATNHFPHGGFLVCKLQSLWFYEYTDAGQEVRSTKIGVEGPFISMSYEPSSENLLVFARASTRYPQSRYIIGKLEKIDDLAVFNVKVSFFGSKATPVMTRCTQIAVENNTLVAGYIQDAKLLSLFDMKREQRLQSMPVQEVVYDTCPVYVSNNTFLGALTETKCRIYKVITMDNGR
ncbi:E3 ubiquitin-protein ligase RFWD3 [Eupeodes corollae]|uniref:E3 ubiquitin-protein ligase RFWD3 n=1 Tax=Eupeodes corollae TaxID=290404 RepID=UPI002492FADE|nr:E3 ubiquitin-protein ligase RFWD3 [Eupeodes corollae]XP_055914421.1 E3 ubiquitin-protein ligase RFWD3 [Eupeodes corollae]XP_055914422.1 E3 ubiquitin-protein ligase RFWD3 [Eupeodes corollae]